MKARGIGIVLLVSLLTVQTMAGTGGRADMPKEKLYSIFLYQFARYVDWPAGKGEQEFVIGIYGESGVTPLLEAIAGTKKVKDATMRIKVIERAADISDCHLLFVPQESTGMLPELSELAGAAQTLIVTESPKGISKGAVISFIEVDQRLNFELSIEAAQTQGFKVSNALLQLAASVK